MTMAFRLEETSISCADVMYRSRRSFFSSELVASKSNRACQGGREGAVSRLRCAEHWSFRAGDAASAGDACVRRHLSDRLLEGVRLRALLLCYLLAGREHAADPPVAPPEGGRQSGGWGAC